jgi:hypothetical protein
MKRLLVLVFAFFNVAWGSLCGSAAAQNDAAKAATTLPNIDSIAKNGEATPN